MTDSLPTARPADCELCEAARLTPWFHEDEVCWIAVGLVAHGLLGFPDAPVED